MDIPSSFADELRLDTQGYIDQDCHCVSCGYNLRGLNPNSICPECATPIGRSAHGDFLRFSDPTWVETLAEGMQWIVAGILVSIVVGGCVGGGVSALGAAGGNTQAVTLFMALLGLGISLIYFVGYWKVTAPDPAKMDPSTAIDARQIVRFWAISSVILTPVGHFLPPSLDVLPISIMVIGGAIDIAGTIAAFLYAIMLAQRVPDLRLAGQTRIVMWGTIIWATLILLSAFAFLGTGFGAGAMGAPAVPGGGGGAGGLSPVFMMITGGACVVVIGALVFGIWSIVLAFRYRTAFRRAANEARASWAREIASTHGAG
jgi:hypothetical protein